jgi:hypothetical protein
MLRGVSSNGPFGEANQRVIDAFDTNYLLSADEVTANIPHLAHNMEGELPGADVTARSGPTSPISDFTWDWWE